QTDAAGANRQAARYRRGGALPGFARGRMGHGNQGPHQRWRRPPARVRLDSKARRWHLPAAANCSEVSREGTGMLFLHELHKVIGLKIFDFEDAYRTGWMPTLGRGDDAR